MVGDEKQSIYRFRGADVTVFNRPREPLAILPRPLRENRRSLPAIVNFVNAVSAHSMRPDDDPDGKPYKVKWSEEHRLQAIRPAGDAPAVELIVGADARDADGAKRNASAARRIEADAIARRCARMIGESIQVTDMRTGAARRHNSAISRCCCAHSATSRSMRTPSRGPACRVTPSKVAAFTAARK